VMRVERPFDWQKIDCLICGHIYSNAISLMTQLAFVYTSGFIIKV